MSLSTKIGLSVLLDLLAISGVLGYVALQAVSESTDRTMDDRVVLARIVADRTDADISQLSVVSTDGTLYKQILMDV